MALGSIVSRDCANGTAHCDLQPCVKILLTILLREAACLFGEVTVALLEKPSTFLMSSRIAFRSQVPLLVRPYPALRVISLGSTSNGFDCLLYLDR